MNADAASPVAAKPASAARSKSRKAGAPSEAQYQVAVIGAGFAGLCMAIQLKKSGIHSFVVLEKASDIGGTWRDNLYPGCACDVPSHLYSYSFEPNPNWSRMFAPQQEIWAYLRHCAAKYQVLPHMRFGAEVASAEFDTKNQYWKVTTCGGDRFTASIVVSGIGALSIPAYPKVPGIDKFKGRTFHSARWDQDYDFKGKRVAVIGTGASAIQFVPAIAPRVKHLDLYQRTPPWVISKPDRRITALEQTLFKYLPATQKLFRGGIYWWMESRVLGLAVDPRAMRLAEAYAKFYIKRCIADPKLRKKVTPDYTLGCKRILMSDEYYPALTRDNVDVVTEGIREVKARSVVTQDGVERPADAIVYGTGFQVSDPIGPMKIVGANGEEVRDTWKDSGMEAYLGVSVSGFPNFFMLLGPNTGLGHTSIIFMIEAQVNYVMQAVKTVLKEPSRTLDVKPEVQRRFNQKLQQRLDQAVWSAGGCKSWYLDEFGKNRTLWPSFTFEYWMRTRKFEPAKYALQDHRG